MRELFKFILIVYACYTTTYEPGRRQAHRIACPFAHYGQIKSGFTLALVKLKKRVFCGFTKRFAHPRFSAKNADFLYNGFNERGNSIVYTDRKMISDKHLSLRYVIGSWRKYNR
jgi:hypothetical protein